MKKIVITIALLVGASSFAQKDTEASKVKKAATDINAKLGKFSEKSSAELKAEKAKLSAEIATLNGKLGAIDVQLANVKGWKFGGIGTIGATFSGYKDWLTNGLKNSTSSNIGVALTGFADLKEDAYFWKNTANLNLGWTSVVNLDDKNLTDKQKEYVNTADVLNITSLFGYKIMPQLAASVLGEYKTTVVENFNNPGYLDIGAGITWTPMAELFVTAHPLNYNYVFSDSESTFESSLGCKLMAEYKKDFGFLKYRSNASAFLSYGDTENLSNWTWVNSLGLNLYKGIGIGLDCGLKQNKQEAFNKLGGADKYGELKNSDNPLQSFWLLGLSYSL